MKIALATIKEPTWNSRLSHDPKTIAHMAEDFKNPTIGQLQPIEVETNGIAGEHILVIGSRRVAAAKAAGWTEIEATVKPPSTDAERLLRNGIENVKRENLSSYEEARLCAALRDIGLKNPDIATKLGFSSQKVSNLNASYTKLPAPILKEWERENPIAVGASGGFLRELANEGSPEKMMQVWDDKVREAAERGKAEKGGRGKGKDKEAKGGSAGFPVSQKRLSHLIIALSSKGGSPDMTDDVRKWAKALLDYVVQAREKPPAGVPAMPAAEKKEKKAAKAK